MCVSCESYGVYGAGFYGSGTYGNLYPWCPACQTDTQMGRVVTPSRVRSNTR